MQLKSALQQLNSRVGAFHRCNAVANRLVPFLIQGYQELNSQNLHRVVFFEKQ